MNAKIPMITTTIINVAIIVIGESSKPTWVENVVTASVMLAVIVASKPDAVPACSKLPAMKKPTTLYTKKLINDSKNNPTISSPTFIPLLIELIFIVIVL